MLKKIVAKHKQPRNMGIGAEPNMRPPDAISPIGDIWIKGLKFRSQQSHVARTQLHHHIHV